MKFFIDTACVKELEPLMKTGFVDGVTTNPSLVAKTGRPIKEVVGEICDLVQGPVSVEVAATTYDDMMREAEILRALGSNIVIKVPLTLDGLWVCTSLKNLGVQVNVTLCFSATQALLAAKAGASYISPFLGRLDDVSHDGMGLMSDIIQIYDNYAYQTEILAASIRHPMHVLDAARLGADVVTLPPKTLYQLLKHPLTDSGLATFLKDWQAAGQSITA